MLCGENNFKCLFLYENKKSARCFGAFLLKIKRNESCWKNRKAKLIYLYFVSCTTYPSKHNVSSPSFYLHLCDWTKILKFWVRFQQQLQDNVGIYYQEEKYSVGLGKHSKPVKTLVKLKFTLVLFFSKLQPCALIK